MGWNSNTLRNARERGRWKPQCHCDSHRRSWRDRHRDIHDCRSGHKRRTYNHKYSRHCAAYGGCSVHLHSNRLDPDGNAQAVYTYDASSNPDWLSFTDNGDGTATLTGTPDNSDVGDHTVAFSVSDGTATDTASFTITVANTQDASTGSISITGDAYEGLTLTADTSLVLDDDGVGTFTYQWSDADGAITGATSSTYTIPACNPTTTCASIGKVYSVTAVHIDAYGVVEALSLSAGPTSAVVINPTGDLDSDGISNDVDTDIDGDGYTNDADAFDYDGTEWYDTDSDGTGNNADTDDDNDGICDTAAFDNVATGATNAGSVVPCYNGPDDFPLDSSEQFDADGDGWGHNADVDDDGDGILDAVDTDRDGDGDPDATDQFPDNHREWDDTDSDGIGNNGDTDDDGDGTLDVNDAFPLDNTEDTDTDADGIGNNADTDDDGDGYSDADETTNWQDCFRSARRDQHASGHRRRPDMQRAGCRRRR